MENFIAWNFNKNKAVLLVIDMQNDFVKEGAIMEVPMARRNLPNMKKFLIHAANIIYRSFSRHMCFSTNMKYLH